MHRYITTFGVAGLTAVQTGKEKKQPNEQPVSEIYFMFYNALAATGLKFLPLSFLLAVLVSSLTLLFSLCFELYVLSGCHKSREIT